MRPLPQGGNDERAEQSAAIRRRTAEILAELAEKAGSFELSEPPADLGQLQRKLAGDMYKVLVIGAAKRGKSTFINALIGRPLLPVAEHLTTGQIFQVRQAEQERFGVRFEDGSVREITQEDLPRYGAPLLLGEDQDAPATEPIRWIEVETPGHYLPTGISMLDTPGLGSLQAQHTQITQRFVPDADAVIYALDSSQPIGYADLQYIETVLATTPHIFFIQTMIDQHKRDHWQALQRRNQEILKEQFGDRLDDTRVWPIASTLLLKAAQTGDADYLAISRYKELAKALEAFLAHVVGWSRSAQALLLADEYHSAAEETLLARQAAYGESSAHKPAELREKAEKRRKQFQNNWGPQGEKRKALLKDIKDAIKVGRDSFSQALQPTTGAIHTGLEARIDALTSIAEAKALGEGLYSEVVAATTAMWQQMNDLVQARCAALLKPFGADADALTGLGGLDLQAPSASKQVDLRIDISARIKSAQGSALLGIGIMHIFSPIAVLAPLGAVWMLWQGYKEAEQRQLKTAQQELKRYLTGSVQQVRRYFFDADLLTGRPNRIDTYFGVLEEALTKEVQAIAKRRSAEADKEVQRLKQAATLDEEQRKAEAARIQQQLTAWQELGRAIELTLADLQALDHAWLPAPMSGA